MPGTAVKTFLITGVSSGLGRALAVAALDAGHTVVGTVRHPDDASAFEALHPTRAVARMLDVTDEAAVPEVVDGIEAGVGPIDVVVCNAGYGHEGTVEESTMDDLRRQFEVNVFGAVAVIKAALPYLRARRSGHIIAITSMGGLVTFPGLGFYHGSKYALEGIVEALGKEVKSVGIRVTAVEPGSFRTDWAGRSMVRATRTVPDYDDWFERSRAKRLAAHGNQQGDPARAAQAILAIVEAPDPPRHLLLGSDALRLVGSGRRALDEEIRAWEALSRSTDFPST